MKKRVYNRILSLVLALAVFVMFPVAFSQEAQAASGKTKTFYVVTSSKTVHKHADGKKDTFSYTRTYDKNGLWKTNKNANGKNVVTRNKKGYLTKSKRYDKNGKLTGTYTYKLTYNKKGYVTKSKMYYKAAGKKKKLDATWSYTYYSNNNYKTVKGKEDNATYLEEYRKNGTLSSSTTKYGDGSTYTVTYDKHGNEKKRVEVRKDEPYKSTCVHTTMQYDKNGNLVKDVYTYTNVLGDTTDTSTFTDTTQYTYDSHKNIKKSVTTRKVTSSYGKPFTDTITYTAKYKAVKVAKKYWHLVK